MPKLTLLVFIETPEDSTATAQEFIDGFHQLVEYDLNSTEMTLPEWEGVDFRDYAKVD